MIVPIEKSVTTLLTLSGSTSGESDLIMNSTPAAKPAPFAIVMLVMNFRSQ